MSRNENAILIANKTKALRGKLEPFLLAAACIAVMLKTQHVPLVGILLVISLYALGISSFLSAFESQDEDERFDKKIIVFLNYLRGWGLSILYVGIMFSIQNWPGNKSMLVTGVMISLVTLMLERTKNIPSQKVFLRFVLVLTGIAFLATTQQQLYDLGIIHSIIEMPSGR